MNRLPKLRGLPPLASLMGLVVYLCLVAIPTSAAPAWLIATSDEMARAGETIEFDVVKPAAQSDWPAVLRLRMVRDSRMLELDLTAVGPVKRRTHAERIAEYCHPIYLA